MHGTDVGTFFCENRRSAESVRARAGKTLGVALALGLVTQALFWRAGCGLNFFVWTAMAGAVAIGAYRRGPVTRVAWGVLVTSLASSLEVARFASAWTFALAVPTTLASLALLPVVLREGAQMRNLASAPLRVLVAAGALPSAARAIARLPGDAVGDGSRALVRSIGKGLVFGAPVAGLFGLLLSSDAGFAHMVARIVGRAGDAILFVFDAALCALGYLLAYGAHTRARELAAVPRGALPYRTEADAAPWTFDTRAARLSPVTWAMIVGQVGAVFGIFVLANLRSLFGGDALVHASGSLTYASYLHAGFGALLAASGLSVCLLLVGHAFIRLPAVEGAPQVRLPGGRLVVALEALLLALAGVTVLSCAQRLAIYVDAYGATLQRLGVGLTEVAVLAVLLLTLAKVVRRGWTGYAGALLVLAAGLSLAATAFNADAYVARTNLDRAARGRPFDDAYLARVLSVDAAAARDHAYVRAHPELEALLSARLVEGCRHGELRARRGLEVCAAARLASDL